MRSTVLRTARMAEGGDLPKETQRNGESLCNNTLHQLRSKEHSQCPVAPVNSGSQDNARHPLTLREHQTLSGKGKAAIERLIHGDCLDVLKTIADKSIDHFCTDAPYGLGIGGAKWDDQLPSIKIWQECYRTLKPGGLMFAMSSARQDLLSAMISDIGSVGFDVSLPSLYWSFRRDGLPRGYNISKAIDRRKGKLPGQDRSTGKAKKYCTGEKSFPKGKITRYYAAPETDLAKQFIGAYSGFNPTPAVEVIIVAMRPIEEKTFLEQALANGKGVSWLGNCRTPFVGREYGRHPSTLIVSDKVLGRHSDFFDLDGWTVEQIISNAPKEVKETLPFLVVQKERSKQKSIENGEIPNPHLTAKPLQLMLYLITMGSQPGDLICDPFMGSGTTLEAAKMLDRQFIGIERDKEYYDFAAKRLKSKYLKRVAQLQYFNKITRGMGLD